MPNFNIKAGELKDLMGGDGKVRLIPSGEEPKEAEIDPKYKDMPGDQVIVPEGRPTGGVVVEEGTDPMFQLNADFAELLNDVSAVKLNDAQISQIRKNMEAIKNLLG